MAVQFNFDSSSSSSFKARGVSSRPTEGLRGLFQNRFATRGAGLLGLCALLLVGSLSLTGCGAYVVKSASAAVTGTLVATPTAVSFGAVPVGTRTNTTVTLANQGTAAVQVSAVTVSGQAFTMGTQMTLPATLQAGSTLSLTVQFAPSASGAASGQLTVVSDASDGATTVVGLSGMGATPATQTQQVSALTCTSAQLTGAGTDACTVTLAGAAPSGGQAVSLTSNNAAVTVPASVNVASGATTANFTATASAVATTQTATLTADGQQTFALQLNPATAALSLSTRSLAFGSVALNTAATQTVTLNSTGTQAVTVSEAAITGTGFALSSSSLPATLNPGQSTTLTVKFDPSTAGSATGQLTITSNSSTGGTATVSLSGTGTSSAAALSAISCTASSFAAAGSDACTVTLTAAAPSGGQTVSLSSNKAAVVVPASVTVPAGTTTASFTATVASVTSTQTATLTGTAGGASGTFAIQLLAPATLNTLSCTTNSYTAAANDSCSVTLTSAAPTGGLAVALGSNNTAVAVPASVTVPAGATSASFSAVVAAVTTAQTATLTATAGSVAKTFAIQLSLPTPTLSVSTTTVPFGQVSLNTTATQSVTLSSTGTAALTIKSVTLTGTGFALSGASVPASLNPGQNATVNIAFDPATAGAATGQLAISSNSSTGASLVVNLTGTGVVGYSVDVTWDAPATSDPAVASYNVYRAASGSSTYQLVASANTATAFVDSNVQSSNSYVYYVTSVSAGGIESVPSNTASVTIP